MKQAATLTERQLKQVLAHCATRQHAARDRAIVLTSFWAGLRAKEIAALTVADVKAPKKDTISHPENLAKARNEETDLEEALVTTSQSAKDRTTTDEISGREEGGKSNSFKSFKLKLKTDGEMKAPAEDKPEETARVLANFWRSVKSL